MCYIAEIFFVEFRFDYVSAFTNCFNNDIDCIRRKVNIRHGKQMGGQLYGPLQISFTHLIWGCREFFINFVQTY